MGSVSGAVILYAFGRHGGRPLLLRYGQVLRLDERRLDRADDWFDRHGPKIVFLGRMLPGVRSVVSVPAGLSEMRGAGVPGADQLGSALWNAALIGAGWALGGNWREVSELVGPLTVPVIVTVTLPRPRTRWYACAARAPSERAPLPRRPARRPAAPRRPAP